MFRLLTAVAGVALIAGGLWPLSDGHDVAQAAQVEAREYLEARSVADPPITPSTVQLEAPEEPLELETVEVQEGATSNLAPPTAEPSTSAPPEPLPVEPPPTTIEHRPVSPTLLDLEATPQGTPLGTIQIPAIDVDWVYLLGVTRPTLNEGPGLTPWYEPPGGEGAAVIAGHRTTYGAPFNRIDELEPGDEIILEADGTTYTYEVRFQEVVYPEDWKAAIEARRAEGDRLLVLSACTPKGSAAQRLLVFAELVSPDLAATPTSVVIPAS